MEKVTNTARINALLHKFKDNRALLAVKIGEHDTTFTTAIIEVNNEQGYLILDELKPDSGDKLLREASIVKARAQIEGVVISFIAKVSEFGDEDGIPFYKLSIPPVIGYLQRRNNVRIRIGAAQALSAKVSIGDEACAEGFVDDISLGGLRINFKKDLLEAFQKDETLSCEFTLMENKREKLSCQIKICAIKNKSDRFSKPFIGAQFVELERDAERQLQKLIMNLQRSMQQKRNN